VTRQGDITFHIQNGQASHKIILKDTLYAPTMPVPLISISCITKSGYKLTFGKDGARLINGTEIFKVPAKNGLYTITSTNKSHIPAANPENAKIVLTPTELH
jgi:hypothetical protein